MFGRVLGKRRLSNADARLLRSIEEDIARPLADRYLIREYVEIEIAEGRVPDIDGQYLHDLLQLLEEEIAFLMIHDSKGRTLLSMCQARVTEAKNWALEYGKQKGNALYVVDRRRHRRDDPELERELTAMIEERQRRKEAASAG